MGVRLQLAPHLVKLMSPEDQARYSVVADIGHAAQFDVHRSRKVTTDEKTEQRTFARWLQLQNSNGRKIPFVWHSTASRSKASIGTPDFFCWDQRSRDVD
jgi:hypothetical protein